MTIPVASVGKSGSYASYSTSGASVFISAPSGDMRTSYTTVITAVNDGKCTNGGDGTSLAAPSEFLCGSSSSSSSSVSINLS